MITLILITSKAKYKNVESIDLASGTINYTPADIDIVAINIENESGNYESVDTIPTSGYSLSSESYCNANGVKDTNVVLTYQNGKVGASNITKRIKCYLYFDKYSAIDTIIGDTTGIQEKTSFTGIATSTDTGIYKAPDDYGTSYYFRGVESELNNWVKFAGFYWRIIRINGNGSIRMIYSGVANGAVSSSNKTGETIAINGEYYSYNEVVDDNTYVGYMKSLDNKGATTSYEMAHQNIFDSDVKVEVDGWYKTHIIDTNLNNYVDINAGFCNDREIANVEMVGYNQLGYGKNATLYAPSSRIDNNKEKQVPVLQCTNKERDLFSHINANIGNKKLKYPVGLLTSDEAVFAGGYPGESNRTFYLDSDTPYWTMSPYDDGSRNSNNFPGVYYIWYGYINAPGVNSKTGIRPVINLRADTKFTYNSEETKGSESDPFVVSLNN